MKTQGVLKEDEMIYFLNNRKIKELSPNLNTMLQTLYGVLDPEWTVYCENAADLTKPDFVVTVNGKVVASSEYTVSYSISGNEMPKKLKLADDENEKIITVTVKSKGRSFTDGTKELSTTYRVYRDTKTGISKAKISLVVKDGTKALKNVAYTGSPVTFDPSNKNRQGDIKVKIGKTVLTGAQVFENFDVTYADNIEKGKATIILTAKESSPYSGMRTVTFKIVKRKVK